MPLAFIIVAVILFILEAIGFKNSRVNFDWLGLAFYATAALPFLR